MAEINLKHFEQLDDGNNNFMDETEYEKKKRKEKKIIDGIVAEINGCNLSVQSIIRNGNVEEDIEEQNLHLLETKKVVSIYLSSYLYITKNSCCKIANLN